MNAAQRSRIAAAMRRRWRWRKLARLPEEPRSKCAVFAEDARLLRQMFNWPEAGPSVALSLRALLRASRGILWRLDTHGQPKPTPSFFGALTGSPR